MKMTLVNSTILQLLNFDKYSSFEQALKEAAVDNGFQVVLLSEEYNPLIIVETRHETTIDKAIRRGRSAALGLNESYRFIDIDGVKTYWGAVEISGSRYYLLIVDNEGIYNVEDMTTLGVIIELSMGLWKYTPELDAKAEFVKALVRGNKSLAYSLKDEAGVHESDILSVFYGKHMETEHMGSVLGAFKEKGLLDIISINEGSETYAVILKGQYAEKSDESEEKNACAELYDALKEGGKAVRIFHVSGIGSIEAAGDGFRIISETWAFVEKIFPYKRVFTKYELVLATNCTNIQVSGGIFKKNFMDLLDPFKEKYDNKARQLLATLETFVLDAGMNSAKTADFMGVHTNTVQYRLKKINEMLGVDITGNRVIPGLTIALALQRLENAE